MLGFNMMSRDIQGELSYVGTRCASLSCAMLRNIYYEISLSEIGYAFMV